MNANPIIDSYDPTWLGPVRSWLSGDSAKESLKDYSSIIAEAKDTPCDRPES